MSPTACVCGFVNSPEAKFCGGCARPLAPPQLKCPVCGHVNLPGAKFCENDATPLDAGLSIPEPARETQPAPIPAKEERKREEAPKKKKGVVGTIIALGQGSLRMVPNGATDKPMIIRFPMRFTMRVMNLAVPGDDIEVYGRRHSDGTIEAKRIVNLKTGVIVIGGHGAWRIPVFTIVAMGIVTLVVAGNVRLFAGPEIMIVLIVVLLIIIVATIFGRGKEVTQPD